MTESVTGAWCKIAGLAACGGRLPECGPVYEGAAATALVHADRAIHVAARAWPQWAVDRPRPGSRIRPGEPFCTVLARAETAAQARELVHMRRPRMLADADARAA